MARVIVKVGDIFRVEIGAGWIKYFQYIGADEAQLGSAVIRVFRQPHAPATPPDLSQIAAGEVEFHAHAALTTGIKWGFGEKKEKQQ